MLHIKKNTAKNKYDPKSSLLLAVLLVNVGMPVNSAFASTAIVLAIAATP